jgi:hypothetical protein
MKKILSIIVLSSTIGVFSQNITSWNNEKITVKKASSVQTVMHADEIFRDRWDVLEQAQFWKKIMLLSPDTCLINVAANRQVLLKMSKEEWNLKTEEEKTAFKNDLILSNNLPLESTINVTFGKSDFYRFQDVYPTLSKGVEAFEKLGVDPWYAQSILLIESPGQLKKSSAGAYGPFQLMPDVARSMGLVVNDKVDERKDFHKSAMGAAKLISRICIPEAKRILNRHGITYNENELWFRLFVMHVYHAGAGNVSAVVAKIQPTEGSQKLITEMWQTKAAKFGSGSQNYSQLAIAAQLILHDMIYTNCDEIEHYASK